MGSIGRPATKSSTRRTDPHTSAAPLNYDDREMSAFSETRIDADVDAFGNGGAEIVAYVIERPEYLSPTWTHVARVRPQTDANLAERSDYHFRVCVGNVEICQTDGCQIVFTATADGHGDNQNPTCSVAQSLCTMPAVTFSIRFGSGH